MRRKGRPVFMKSALEFVAFREAKDRKGQKTEREFKPNEAIFRGKVYGKKQASGLYYYKCFESQLADSSLIVFRAPNGRYFRHQEEAIHYASTNKLPTRVILGVDPNKPQEKLPEKTPHEKVKNFNGLLIWACRKKNMTLNQFFKKKGD